MTQVITGIREEYEPTKVFLGQSIDEDSSVRHFSDKASKTSAQSY